MRTVRPSPFTLLGMVLSVAAFPCGTAFHSIHHNTVRVASTTLHSKAGDAVKFLLVPNYKKVTPYDEISSTGVTVEDAPILDTVATTPDAALSTGVALMDAGSTVVDPVPTSVAVDEVVGKVTATVAPLWKISPSADLNSRASVVVPSILNTADSSFGQSATATATDTSEKAPLLYEYIALNVQAFFDEGSVTVPVFPKELLITSLQSTIEVLQTADWVNGDRKDIVARLATSLNLNELGGWYTAFVVLALMIYGGLQPLWTNGDLARSAPGYPKIPAVKTAASNPIAPAAPNVSATAVPSRFTAPKPPVTPPPNPIEETESGPMLIDLVAELNAIKEERLSFQSNIKALQSELKSMKKTIKTEITLEKELQDDLEKANVVNKGQQEQLDAILAAKTLLQEEVAALKAEVVALRGQIKDPDKGAPANKKSTAKKAEKAKDVTKEKTKESMMKTNVNSVNGTKQPMEKVTIKPVEETLPPPTPVKFFATAMEEQNEADAGHTQPKAVGDTVQSLVTTEEDWSTLAQSTLRRKTVKELTDYLESKGAPVTDREGKALKKSDLVDAVLAIRS